MAPRVPRQKKPRFDALKARKTVFGKRFPNIKKKAHELSVLCDISVVVICYDLDNTLHVWPEDKPEAVKQILTKFVGLSDEAREKHASHLSDFLPTISTKKMNAAIGADSSTDFDDLSPEQLVGVVSTIESKMGEILNHAKNSEKKKTVNDSSQQLISFEDNGVLNTASNSDYSGCGQFGEISDFGLSTDDVWALLDDDTFGVLSNDDDILESIDFESLGDCEADAYLPDLYQMPSTCDNSDDIWEGISAEDPILTKPSQMSELYAMEVTNIWEMEPLYTFDM